MTVTTTTVYDGHDRTDFKDVDDVAHCISLRTVWKAGSPQFNLQALQTAAINAITTLNTAETLLVPGGSAWDTATAAQRSTLMLGLVRDVRALIRITLNVLDQPS